MTKTVSIMQISVIDETLQNIRKFATVDKKNYVVFILRS